MVVTFTLDSYRIMALNGGAQYKFNEAMSLVVGCDTQEEIDYYWSKLTQGGEEGMCGWLKDKYGVSWQIVPKILGELMKDPDRSPRVVQALNQMIKFDIEALKKA
jgi:predicted 3-demethylubiquinone-9 3-methyltransferase (glyoxalase superfamily)